MLRCLKMLKHLSEATIFTELIIELYNCEIYVTLPVMMQLSKRIILKNHFDIPYHHLPVSNQMESITCRENSALIFVFQESLYVMSTALHKGTMSCINRGYLNL
ncbi:hypothetical protein OUZ56_017705 [Daphnia magna]|uniref:Uncharacterized protein n=1 Tax=Daphnia magna TaxID=35525 RepID=A0ABR0ATI5_9CRUS|nr:hypothetical protein OUZ56_017705 [Daphnia magna]